MVLSLAKQAFVLFAAWVVRVGMWFASLLLIGIDAPVLAMDKVIDLLCAAIIAAVFAGTFSSAATAAWDAHGMIEAAGGTAPSIAEIFS